MDGDGFGLLTRRWSGGYGGPAVAPGDRGERQRDGAAVQTGYGDYEVLRIDRMAQVETHLLPSDAGNGPRRGRKIARWLARRGASGPAIRATGSGRRRRSGCAHA
jgi:hypothetical protein